MPCMRSAGANGTTPKMACPNAAHKKQRPRDALGKGEPLSSVEDAEKSGVSSGPGHRGVDTPRSPFARKVPKSTSGNEKEIGMKPLGDGISSGKEPRTKFQEPNS